MTPYELAQQQRRALLARDASTATRLIRAYAAVDKDLQVRLAALTDLIELRRLNGESVSQSWLNSEERYQAVLAQVEAETRRLAEMTGRETQTAAAAAQSTGMQDAAALIRSAAEEAGITGSFQTLPRLATEAAASSLQDGAPLSRLIERITREMPAEAVQRAKNVIQIAVSTGQGARVVAANFRAATGASLDRSLLIARTELLRSYRQAALQTYQESEVVESWIWTASLSARSCAACIALHNSIHPKDEPFGSHPRCRCCPRPLVRGGKVRGQSGEDWFAGQDEDVQRRVLGTAALEAYQRGEVRLADFVHHEDHRVYGSQIRRGSLEQARGAAVKVPASAN